MNLKFGLKILVSAVSPVVVFAVASSALADQRALSPTQLVERANAVHLAMNGRILKSCNLRDGLLSPIPANIIQREILGDLAAIVNPQVLRIRPSSVAGTVTTDGRGPALIFYTTFGVVGRPDYRTIDEIYSSSDDKAIVKIIHMQQDYETLNTGTLTNPVMAMQWVTTAYHDCK